MVQIVVQLGKVAVGVDGVCCESSICGGEQLVGDGVCGKAQMVGDGGFASEMVQIVVEMGKVGVGVDDVCSQCSTCGTEELVVVAFGVAAAMPSSVSINCGKVEVFVVNVYRRQRRGLVGRLREIGCDCHELSELSVDFVLLHHLLFLVMRTCLQMFALMRRRNLDGWKPCYLTGCTLFMLRATRRSSKMKK